MNNGKLNLAINKIYKEAIKLSRNERVLIIGTCEKNSQIVSWCFFEQAKKIAKDTVLIFQNGSLEEISESVRASALTAPDLIIITDVERLGGDKKGEKVGYKLGKRKYNYVFYYLKDSFKSRVFWFYVNDIDLFCKNAQVDYKELGRISRRIKKEIGNAEKIHVTSKNGTDLWVDVTDKSIKPQADFDGSQHKPGSGINIPMGEVLVTPTRGKSHGVAVVDGTYYDDYKQETISPQKPFKIHIKDGFVERVEITCPEARDYEKMVKKAEKEAERAFEKGYFSRLEREINKKNSRLFCEFAIGVNPKATLAKDFLIDEKILGTCHFAVGMSYDGDPALLHSDALLLCPKIEFHYPKGRRKVVVENRRILV